MYIAVAAQGETLASKVSPKFADCRCVLIVHLPELTLEAVPNKGDVPAIGLAQVVVDKKCEALISGELAPAEFDVLADACVTRYNGAGHPAGQALELMENYALPLIRDYLDHSAQSHRHGHSSECCGGHHHD